MVITAGLYPFDGATEINVDQTIEIPFTEPVNIDTNTNLYVREKGTDTQIPITSVKTELLPGIYKLKLEHEHFDFNKQYEIIITDGIRDMDNEALSNPMTISFKTKELKIDAELGFNDQYTAINDQVINEVSCPSVRKAFPALFRLIF